jgi:hypothetical protein
LNPRVRLVNIGPFRDVEVEVKPLTVSSWRGLVKLESGLKVEL